MNRIKKLTILILMLMVPALTLSTCKGDGDEGNEETYAAITTLAIVTEYATVTALATGIQIAGTWNYYNGTSEYAGDSFNDKGTVLQGTYSFTNAAFNYASTKYSYNQKGTVLEYDNANQIAYVQYSSDDAYSPNKYSWFKWTVSAADGKYYVCPDLVGVSAQDTLAKAKSDDYSAEARADKINDGCGMSSQIGAIFWSRLERQ